MARKPIYYLANPKLKAANVDIEFTREQAIQFNKCRKDPIYFIKNYVKIIHVDRGLVPFELYDYQEEMIDKFNQERFVVCKTARQVGKSTTCVAYLLWYILFNDEKSVAILANKAATSREILSRLQLAYENLPFWLQQGVVEWNKGNIELENGSKVLATSTSSSAIRGFTCVTLDTYVTIREKTTGVVITLTILELLKKQSPEILERLNIIKELSNGDNNDFGIHISNNKQH